MQEIPKTYDPAASEAHWYAWWMEKDFFRSTPDEREPYTIVIPPPNVTGVLHMGHMLNNTIQDVLVRRARMQGKNACWVPGTDHASIATEAKVVALLKEKGINKRDLSREKFLEYAWEWKEKYGGIILEQLKKLGASCDWERTSFTMSPELSEAVIDVFIDLYKKGHIYRGTRMVNWDPSALTAVSDEEVYMKETTSKLYYVRYQVEGSNDFVTIATTRPETILGDTAVCVHPEDERYTALKGKRVIVPLVKRSVPVIFDEYVDKEFGTGALKVTPAHDKNDYELGKKHKLESIEILNADGTMSPAAQLYIGQDRFAVRKAIVKDLEEAGHLVKVDELKNSVGYSERTHVVIEPRLSMQWFVSMKEISKSALDHVLNGDVKLIPDKFLGTYRHWMENVHDWCISRQLWWGQRIPAWYDEAGNFVVAKTVEEAIGEFQAVHNKTYNENQVKQDEDVVDTWFSSWLWPITVFDPKAITKDKKDFNEDLKYYYPTNDLVTAPEILFFWVARMIIAGYEYTGEKPFSNVYLTGIVRDKQGRKMSKSLGNSPDPLDLIAKYGADGVRVGMLLCSPAGNDLPFDEALCEQGRNFSNKIWNAFRLVSGFAVDKNAEQPAAAKTAIEWFSAKFNQQLAEINDHYAKFRLSDALMATYKLVWDDFCSWYLEMVKPEFVDGQAKPVDAKTLEATKGFFEKILKLLHPFMPFITEELYHHLAERKERDAIIVAPWPEGDDWENLDQEIPKIEIEINKIAADSLQWKKDVFVNCFAFRERKRIPSAEIIRVIVDGQNLHLAKLEFEPLRGLFRAKNIEVEFGPRPDNKDDFFIIGPYGISIQTIASRFAIAEEVIVQVRNIRKQKNIHPRETVELIVKTASPDKSFDAVIQKLAGVSAVSYRDEKPASAAGFLVKNAEYFAPVQVNPEEEKARLAKELEYNKGFLASVQKKLANEKFVQNAKPELIELERRKQADAEAKIRAIAEQLQNL